MIIELLPPETGRAFRAMRELRPHLADEAAFVHQVDEVQRAAGYRLVGSFDAADGPAQAVAGFRLGHKLAWGRHVYVDDLSTLPSARGRGHARAVLE